MKNTFYKSFDKVFLQITLSLSLPLTHAIFKQTLSIIEKGKFKWVDVVEVLMWWRTLQVDWLRM
jgi:hypothetical protein